MNKVKKISEELRISLLKFFPFYGKCLLHTKLLPNEQVQTAGTYDLTIEYNPNFFEMLPEPEVKFIVLHEFFHIFLKHKFRRFNRDLIIWNYACDYVVNSIITKLEKELSSKGIITKIPEFALYNEDYNSMSEEEVYNKLYKQKDMPKFTNNFCTDLDTSPSEKNSENNQTQEIEYSTKESLKDGRSKEENRRALIEEIDKIIVSAQIYEQSCKGYSSSGSSDLERLFKIEKRSGIRLRTLLSRYLRNTIEQGVVTYEKIRKSTVFLDLTLPTSITKRNKLEDLYIFVDVSGSISHDNLSNVLSEVNTVLKYYKVNGHIVTWHTKIEEVTKMNSESFDMRKYEPKGCGGTDFSCVTEFLKNKKYSVAVICTDGEFAYNYKEPKDLIWVVVNNKKFRPKGKKIDL